MPPHNSLAQDSTEALKLVEYPPSDDGSVSAVHEILTGDVLYVQTTTWNSTEMG
jgi:hypothetical protein